MREKKKKMQVQEIEVEAKEMWEERERAVTRKPPEQAPTRLTYNCNTGGLLDSPLAGLGPAALNLGPTGPIGLLTVLIGLPPHVCVGVISGLKIPDGIDEGIADGIADGRAEGRGGAAAEGSDVLNVLTTAALFDCTSAGRCCSSVDSLAAGPVGGVVDSPPSPIPDAPSPGPAEGGGTDGGIEGSLLKPFGVGAGVGNWLLLLLSLVVLLGVRTC